MSKWTFNEILKHRCFGCNNFEGIPDNWWCVKYSKWIEDDSTFCSTLQSQFALKEQVKEK
jgi:hypothetical protein